MGNFFIKLFGMHNSNKYRILIIGLDGAGKTTILFQLKLKEAVNTIPTIGSNIETIVHNNITLNLWDIGGQQKIRPLWKDYFHDDTTAIVFVIDSSDHMRLEEAKDELFKILKEPNATSIPLLVLCNKVDVEGAMSVDFIEQKLSLQSLGRPTTIMPCCGATGDGLMKALEWLSNLKV
eukprot:TRINITY_DN6005_c0_g1_i2.p1 TRINITY_DN6005_c0_g1~~TRINITY_DN6005_c0_g1_i2.p1  ORF type:complete len:203 (-),score=52.12 TRINITY_DN6005_c0_g1_i2:212-745(-)